MKEFDKGYNLAISKALSIIDLELKDLEEGCCRTGLIKLQDTFEEEL